MVAHAFSSGGFINNTVDNLKNETCKAIELKNIVVPYEPRVNEEKRESREVEKKSEKEVVIEEKSEDTSDEEVRGY